MKRYKINEDTLAIVPMGDNDSVIYEVDKMLVINNNPNNIIKNNCEIDGSTYKVRVDSSRSITGNSYKLPIVIQNNNKIVFFPTCSPRLKNVSWINIKSINKVFYNKDDNTSVIELINGDHINIKESIWALNNQILKACRFDFLIRKNET